MTSQFDLDKHRKVMQKVPTRNSKHEVLLRDFLANSGFIDASDTVDLQFLPDIVLPEQKVVIFMHGCYWHRHEGCRFAYDVNPDLDRIKSWRKKFSDNQIRDKRQLNELLSMGWRVLVVWQCGLNANKRAEVYLPQVLDWINGTDQVGEIPANPPVQKH